MVNVLIGVGILACAVLAVREKRLLVSALWLALTSALVSWMMYRLGAAEIAAVELSVGAGLVTVLFVFAINIAGDEPIPSESLVPRPLAWVVVALIVLLLGWIILPALRTETYISAISQQGGLLTRFREVLWQDRGPDVLLQVVLIFAGVLAVVGLISKDDQPDEEEI